MRQFCTLVLSALLLTILASSNQQAGFVRADDKPREKIGEVLGKPVYRDEIRKDDTLASELHRLFTSPVMAKYRKEHEEEIAPSEEEIKAAQKYFDDVHAERVKDKVDSLRAELKAVEIQLKREGLPKEERTSLELKKERIELDLGPPGRLFAEFVLSNWKFQRHLYEKFGGGRALWQQAGVEAFDATRKWLETQEKDSAFEITDPAFRTEFYKYWTTQNHGPFLIKDKDRIRDEFLEPKWATPRPKS